MDALYDFLRGPCLWAAFLICIVGLGWRLAFLYGLSRERDRVFYNHRSMPWGLRSIVRWLLPLGSHSLRAQPVFGVAFFVFHVCLFAAPIFFLAHNLLWKEAFGVSPWSLPESVSDILTLILLAAALFLLARRLKRPEVRALSSTWDYFLLILTALPFLTGFLAVHQVGPYRPMLVLHILTAEVLLVVIPFSKLGHVVLYFFTRAFIGFEMGTRRGAHPW